MMPLAKLASPAAMPAAKSFGTAGEAALILALRPAYTLSSTAGAKTIIVGPSTAASPSHVPVLILTPVGVSVCGEPKPTRAPSA